MRLNKQHLQSIALFLVTVLMAVTYAAAQSDSPREKILASFSFNGVAGSSPSGGLISDAAGNLYGVTHNGGMEYGSVYELSPAENGGWKRTSLYLFKPGTDGRSPVGGLVMDSSGNLYGTTSGGGSHSCTAGDVHLTCGTVFELSPNGSGGWSEKIIYNFSQQDGWDPTTSMILDAAGNLYGTTNYSAKMAEGREGGIVFELQRTGEEWTETVLHTFGEGDDGATPSGPLLFDNAGNLYGETYIGGSAGGGTVFELTNTKSGWKENILFNFASGGSIASGMEPNGGLIVDGAGNLYGTTNEGGVDVGDGCGVAFELAPTNGAWNETVLLEFLCNQYGLADPEAGLVLDSAGNLYGTTGFGGSANAGNTFELRPSANGTWTYSVIYTFQGLPSDGLSPSTAWRRSLRWSPIPTSRRRFHTARRRARFL